MTTLITLACPSCGAILEVRPGDRQYTCRYCGHTHLLATPPGTSQEALILCPLDHHPDVILKVSAITKSQVFEAPPGSSLEQPALYRSELAKKLACPPKPQAPATGVDPRERGLVFALGLAFTTLFAVLGSLVLNELIGGARFFNFVLSFILSGPIVFLLIAKIALPAIVKNGESHRTRLQRWQAAKARWDHAFYCQRHDIVFIEGQDRAIPVEKFQVSLFDDGD